MKNVPITILISTFAILQVYADVRYIDLTYAFNNETAKWPGRVSTFGVEVEGYDEFGLWGASRTFCTSEHTSTHMDAPYHVHKTGATLDALPLTDLLDVPGVMIDIYDKVHSYEDGELKVIENYALTREDILEWEKLNGEIPPRALVLLRSGWGKRWPNEKLYRGTKGETEDGKPDLNFPGFASSAATFLTNERQIVGVGIDTLSIDIGHTRRFPAHRIFAARGKYMLEMVANLHLIPPRGFQLFAVPFKIDDGTGAPTRLLARFDDTKKA